MVTCISNIDFFKAGNQQIMQKKVNPHDSRADNATYRHDRRADKAAYRHDRRADILSRHPD